MSDFIRNLTFHSEELGANATLMLTFDSQPMSGMYENYFPITWKVATFGATGSYEITITYKNQLCVLHSQISPSGVILGSTYRDINPGQKTDMIEDKHGVHFTPLVPGEVGYIQVRNKTGSVQGVGLGLDTNGSVSWPSAVLYWDKVGVDSNINAQFKPILRAYITSQYQENQILRELIQSPVIWEQDLATLRPDTHFTLSYDPTTDGYTITSTQDD